MYVLLRSQDFQTRLTRAFVQPDAEQPGELDSSLSPLDLANISLQTDVIYRNPFGFSLRAKQAGGAFFMCVRLLAHL